MRRMFIHVKKEIVAQQIEFYNQSLVGRKLFLAVSNVSAIADKITTFRELRECQELWIWCDSSSADDIIFIEIDKYMLDRLA